MNNADLIVVGAGVLGAFHAYHALKSGLRVILLEKNSAPMGATVRNFGQIVPSGMPQGQWQHYGIESTRIYKTIQNVCDIGMRQQGSLYIASDEAEMGLLEELAVINQQNAYSSTLLSQEACLKRLPHLKADYCRGGLLFSQEVTVEPRVMIHQLIGYMQEQLGLHYYPATQIVSCEHRADTVQLEDSQQRQFLAEKVIICSGSEVSTLFPRLLANSEIILCKLQMMQTTAYKKVQLPGAILTGLTIRRYESFQECPSFASLNHDHLNPRLARWGIHLLFKQAMDGTIIIGDSHEYTTVKEVDKLGFDLRHDINDLLLEEARRILDLPHWQLRHSWAGIYAQCQDAPLFNKEVATNIHIVTAIGGKGMTTSAGFARENIATIMNQVTL